MGGNTEWQGRKALRQPPDDALGPYDSSRVTQNCRQFDAHFGPDPVPVDDTLGCVIATQTADRSTGRLETDVSARSAIDGGLARGDAYPNSIVSTTHKLTKSVPALRYTFRFGVEHGNLSVSNVAEAHASLSVFARAATRRCDCEAKVSDVSRARCQTAPRPPSAGRWSSSSS